jgi:hypothetical protein
LVAQQASDLQHKQALLDKLTYEMARLKFAAKTEALNTHQRSLLEDALEEDLQAVGEEIAQMRPGVAPTARLQPKRQPLPAQLPRQEFKHEPATTQCCGQPMRRIGACMRSAYLQFTNTCVDFTLCRLLRPRFTAG